MELTVVVIVLFFVLLAVIGRRTQRLTLKSQQRAGVFFILEIKTLIDQLQQHRGLSAAWCRGDNRVEPELLKLETGVKEVILSLDESNFLPAYDRWIAFIDHWQRLSQHNRTLTAENSFKQHTLLINNLLFLLEDAAEQHKLTAEYLPGFDNIGYLWRELLAVTESVGQSRAVGTAVVTVKRCSSVESIRLNYLCQHITHVSENVLGKLKLAQVNAQGQELSYAELDGLIERGIEQTRHLTAIIDDELLTDEDIQIKRAVYFELASQTMEALNHIFDYQLTQLQHWIDDESHHTVNHR